MVSESNGSVKVLDKAIKILKLLSSYEENISYTISDIAKKVNISRTSAYRILDALEANKMVQREPSTLRYSLGWELYRMGMCVKESSDVFTYERIHEEVRALSKWVHEAVSISKIINNKGLVIDSYLNKGNTPLVVNVPIGATEPLYCTAYGKALLSDYSMNEMSRLLAKETFVKRGINTIMTIDSLFMDIEKQKPSGLFWAVDEFGDGISAVAAPVRNFSNSIEVAVSISMPTSRLLEFGKDYYNQELTQSVDVMNKKLGYND